MAQFIYEDSVEAEIVAEQPWHTHLAARQRQVVDEGSGGVKRTL